MKKKVESLLSELEDVEKNLGSQEVLEDPKKYKEVAAKYKYLSALKDIWNKYESTVDELFKSQELEKSEQDPELLKMLQEESVLLEEKQEKLLKEVELLLVPPDPNDHRNTIMELRAGTGGDEAAIFVGDCVRMYRLFSEQQGWKFEELSTTPSDQGGYKEYQFVLSGSNVYRLMKYESGTHRVQRVPETESQGRIHTSAITVAVMFEPDEEETVAIDPKDLRIDTYRSSGAGGQHVNTTDSAVRITHLPTGIVVHCQAERSQIKNRDKAMRLLKAKIAEEKRRRQHEEMASERAGQIGSGDRSERIRTYNFPQNRVTDHRIQLTLYKLDEVMAGSLDYLVEPLVMFFCQKKD